MLSTLLSVTHLVGLALGVGAATTKLALLVRAKADHAFVATYSAVARPITHLILLGTALLVISGIGWLLTGYPLTSWLVVKLVLVAGILVIGPIIDNVVEPKFRQLAGDTDTAPAPAFIRVQRQYLGLEIVATLLFYVVVVYWIIATR
jgi:hypothetical protein